VQEDGVVGSQGSGAASTDGFAAGKQRLCDCHRIDCKKKLMFNAPVWRVAKD